MATRNQLAELFVDVNVRLDEVQRDLKKITNDTERTADRMSQGFDRVGRAARRAGGCQLSGYSLFSLRWFQWYQEEQHRWQSIRIMDTVGVTLRRLGWRQTRPATNCPQRCRAFMPALGVRTSTAVEPARRARATKDQRR